MCDFKPGDEVVCVDSSNQSPRHYWAGQAPVEGGFYTVTQVITRKENVCVLLAEIDNACKDGFKGYRAARFRKVVRKSDKLSLTEWLSQPSGDTERLDKSNKRNRVNG